MFHILTYDDMAYAGGDGKIIINELKWEKEDMGFA